MTLQHLQKQVDQMLTEFQGASSDFSNAKAKAPANSATQLELNGHYTMASTMKLMCLSLVTLSMQIEELKRQTILRGMASQPSSGRWRGVA